jgi:hypothetical protein
MNGEVSFYQNKFNGNEYSLLVSNAEGLKPVHDMALARSKEHHLVLDINLNYQGRKWINSNHPYWKHPVKSLFLKRSLVPHYKTITILW